MLMPTSHFFVRGYTQATRDQRTGTGGERRVGGDAADALEVHRRERAAGLNPYQPNQRITAPSAARVML